MTDKIDWYSIEGETRRYGVGMVECAYAVGRNEVVHVVTHESVKDIAMQHLPTPQQRTWVGLTDIEINDLVHSHDDFDGLWEFADAVEAKLKAKNERLEKNT